MSSCSGGLKPLSRPPFEYFITLEIISECPITLEKRECMLRRGNDCGDMKTHRDAEATSSAVSHELVLKKNMKFKTSRSYVPEEASVYGFVSRNKNT